MASHAENWAAFEGGVELILQQWTALQMAIENSWGGHSTRQKATDLTEDILYWFTLCKADPNVFELKNQLMAAMLEDFNAEIEDGSLEQVSEMMVTLYLQCRSGDYVFLNQLKAKADDHPPSTSVKTTQMERSSSSSSSEDGSSDEMDEDVMSMEKQRKTGGQPDVDADGFTIVSHHRRR